MAGMMETFPARSWKMYVFLGVTEDVVVEGALVPEEGLEEGKCGSLRL